MRVTVTLEHRFFQTPDSAVWTNTGNHYEFWKRYLDVFDSVQVVARVLKVDRAKEDWLRCDGPSVAFSPVSYYVGPFQYLLRMRAIHRSIVNSVASTDAVIMRVGSPIADILAAALRKSGHPYGLEVVGDPYDVFSPGATRHPLRRFLRWWSPMMLRRQCADAAGVAYVTRESLQRRYPSRGAMFAVSDVVIPDCRIGKRVTAPDGPTGIVQASGPTEVGATAGGRGPMRVICVGGFEEMYKAQDILIRAVAACVRSGDDLTLVLVGDGKHKSMLKRIAVQLGIEHRCEFRGYLPSGEAVARELDRADLFVLPSRQEGLPRAMIEAMASGLPCIGSTVGGIPELLATADLVPPNDARSLAAKLHEVIASPSRRLAMSARNIEIAREYVGDALRPRRVAFYRHVERVTSEWIRAVSHAARNPPVGAMSSHSVD